MIMSFQIENITQIACQCHPSAIHRMHTFRLALLHENNATPPANLVFSLPFYSQTILSRTREVFEQLLVRFICSFRSK